MKNNSLTKTLIISATIIVVALIIFFAIKPTNYNNTINVQGISEVKATPNLIGIYFNVETSGETSAEANSENTEIVDALKTSLMALEIEEDEITTQNFNIYKDYDWTNGKRTEKGYKATHSLKIELSTDDSEKIGQVIDAGVDAGAGISYINFELTQDLQNQYKAQAMQEATQDARTKAEAIATGLDKKVGRLVSISTSDFGYSPWNLYTSKGMAIEDDAELAQEAVTSITPSEQTIYGQVSVVLKLR